MELQSYTRARKWWIVAGSLAFTYLFFFEYLPPARQAHIPYDLEGYHYPLADYAYRALRAGYLPQWDPTNYCGMSFVGNIQAAIFYPPMWAAFAASGRRPHLSYQALQVLQIAHIWLSFFLCHLWLRPKCRSMWASLFGAGIFAFSGYLPLQMQHLGLTAVFAWTPLGFLGIDRAANQRRWLAMWPLTVASTLCLLAGYPPAWFVFAVCMLVYAAFSIWRWRAALGCAAALGASLLVAAVQLLPTWIVAGNMAPEIRYGGGTRDPLFYLSYLVPNYFNFSPRADALTNFGYEYLYLGAPALTGLIWLLYRRRLARALPLLAVLATVLVLLTNPFNLVSLSVRHWLLVAQLCREWCFLAGVTTAVSGLAALGLDEFLSADARPAPRWLAAMAICALVIWPLRELWVWLHPNMEFAAGWWSAADAAVSLLVFAAGLYVGRSRRAVLPLLLLATGVDYKVFGTSKRFNARPGPVEVSYVRSDLPDLDETVLTCLQNDRDHRVALDIAAPVATKMRHAGLNTPQGFDPFITAGYKRLLTGRVEPLSNWTFSLKPDDEATLQMLGVRYLITTDWGASFHPLLSNPHWHPMEPFKSYYRVFEYTQARPTFGWTDGQGSATQVGWQPELRTFTVESSTGGLFTLKEQFLPGWTATLDNAPTPIATWQGVFQSVRVGTGRHTVQFRYVAAGLREGAGITAASLLALAALIFRATRHRHSA